jgi:RHS repeat-associated protein
MWEHLHPAHLQAYELSNHLGNVLVTVSDARTANNSAGTIVSFSAVVLSATDYYAFGSPMEGRAMSSDYRYGFNGKENDPETVGTGEGLQDYGMRIYNPGLGRFLSVDPIARSYSYLTPYQFASNQPIWAIDQDGEEAKVVIKSQWFKDQIQAALDNGDIAEAERLTWAAVAAVMPDGSPAASFSADPNGGEGFHVYFDDPFFVETEAVFSMLTPRVFQTPKKPWAKGTIDPRILEEQALYVQLEKLEAGLTNANEKIAQMRSENSRLKREQDHTNTITDPVYGTGDFAPLIKADEHEAKLGMLARRIITNYPKDVVIITNNKIIELIQPAIDNRVKEIEAVKGKIRTINYSPPMTSPALPAKVPAQGPPGKVSKADAG